MLFPCKDSIAIYEGTILGTLWDPEHPPAELLLDLLEGLDCLVQPPQLLLLLPTPRTWAPSTWTGWSRERQDLGWEWERLGDPLHRTILGHNHTLGF